MKEENLVKMKKVSKATAIISKIIAIIMGILFFVLVVCGILSTFAVSQIEFDDKDNIILFDEKIELEEIRSEITGDELAVELVDEFIDAVRDNGTVKNTLIVGSAFTFLAGTILLVMIILLKLGNILSNISNEEVFVEANCNKLNTICILIIGLFMLSLIFNLLMTVLLDLSFELDITPIYYALLVATLSCVFRYGMDNVKVKKTKETE